MATPRDEGLSGDPSADAGAATTSADDGDADAGSDATGDATGAETGPSGPGGDDGPVRFDVAHPDAGGPGDEDGPGCKKVDLLFVIDDSGSMADEQQNLVASFPGFIDAMRSELVDVLDYHVGVTTTDAHFWHINPLCSSVEGALVVQTFGTDASNELCWPYASGATYMTDSDDLERKFACAAQVGTDGDANERPMHTMIQAIGPDLNAPGGCNAGFIRPDALLVVVVITDEEDDPEQAGQNGMMQPFPGSPGDPPLRHDHVVAIKGLETNVVALALVGPEPPNACQPLDKDQVGGQGAEVASRIIAFAETFTHGQVGSVCAPDYAPFFRDAISVIESACDEFVPPG